MKPTAALIRSISRWMRRDLGEADLVDLRGGHVGGGRLAQAMGVIGGAVGQAPGAVVAGGARLDRRERREHRFVAAAERAGQRLAGGGDQPVLLGLRDGEPADLGLEIGEEGAVRARR